MKSKFTSANESFSVRVAGRKVELAVLTQDAV